MAHSQTPQSNPKVLRAPWLLAIRLFSSRVRRKISEAELLMNKMRRRTLTTLRRI